MSYKEITQRVRTNYLAFTLISIIALNSWGRTVTAAEPAVKPLRVLLVLGGCCHDYTTQQELISKGLMARAHLDVIVVQQGGSTTNTKIPLYEKENWSEGFDVVIHDECFAGVTDKAWTQRILQPHKAGLPAVVVHCAMHCYRDGTDEWFQFCGVTSRGHGKSYPHEVLNRDATHPIMKTFGPGWANPAGELYAIEKLWPTAHPLASSKNQENGKDEVCVWTNQYHKGRVFGTTLGHHNETVSHPQYLDLLTRGTLWACDKLNDTYLKPPPPPVKKTFPNNLALGKKASASSEETAKNNFANKAIDGNSTSRWCASNGSKGQWLQVDLGQAEKVTGCHLEWESTGTVYQYTVEGSKDAKSWQLLADASANKKTGTYQHDFQADGLRYFKVTFLGSNTGSWGSIKELRIHGDQLVTLEEKISVDDTAAALLKEVKVPEGFEATIFAAPPAVNYPVFVAAAPDGVVYVSSDKNGSLGRDPLRGSVLRVRDVDGDGKADEVKRFVANVDSPRGLVWDHDRLYLLHPPHLSAFIDKDGDGIADEQKILVKNIAFTFKDRPADHTSNGVTLGIDGWLYLAIGDFGFMQAEGADGTRLQLRAGGVVRVRPDGSGLELYTRGTRNILEVGMSPLLDGFARDNTNDGGGWDIRLHHFTGLIEHGYPSLYKNFGHELVKPLADYGGGSGCGGLYLQEPGFPAGYGDALYTADWGRQWIYRHRMTPNGATYTADQAEFVSVPRVTDLDVDASSKLYVASWKGATFNYIGENVGFLVRVSPKGYTPEPLPDFARLSDLDLVQQIQSPSHRRRLEAQRTLLRRGIAGPVQKGLEAVVASTKQALAIRVAALFTLKQGLGMHASEYLAHLATHDATIREYALRALTDMQDQVTNVPAEPIVSALRDPQPRVRRQASESLARLGRQAHAAALTASLGDEDPIVAHTAVKSLVRLKAGTECLAVVDRQEATSAQRAGALQVLQALHEPALVEALLQRVSKEQDPARRRGLLTALCRLHYRDGPWKGDSWGTRPDTSGPYYQHETWEASSQIAAALKTAFHSANTDEVAFLVGEFTRHKISLDGSLEVVLSLARKDATLIPTAVTQLQRAANVPAQAIPLLLQAATSDATSSVTRAQAVQVLAKLDQAEGVSAMVVALVKLEAAGPSASRELETAREAFLNTAKLDHHTAFLSSEAALHKGRSSVWADAGLLAIAASKSSSVEAKATVDKELDRGWSDLKRRAQILEAVAASKHRPYADRVLAALKESDADVAKAAKKAANELKLDPQSPGTKPSGPKIATLQPNAVIDAVLKTPKGDGRLGEQLFSRLNCNKCHTVKADEPLRGPFLGNIAANYKRKDLTEAVLLPSKTIAQGFVTNSFVLTNGKTVTGFVVQEAADKVTIRDAEAKEMVILATDIDERVKQTVSMMPEGLAKDLTIPELASLIDYLESMVKK